ncbi:MAG TPA: maleylpyruvate isomerase N-terminal domain-containing protein [Streptomyces sp.]|nr:maleylpyruvate isomerase N-terminal domain-containing protein [Streptomyces sp.]
MSATEPSGAAYDEHGENREHTTADGGHAEESADATQHGEPRDGRPGDAGSGTDGPGHGRPDADGPEHAQPAADEPGHGRPDADGPGHGWPGGGPLGFLPGGGGPSRAEPGEPGGPGTARPGTARPGDGRPGEDGRPAPGRPRIPLPRVSVQDGGRPLPPEPACPGHPAPLVLGHGVLKSLLGAWALAACSAAEAAVVEEHLRECAACAEEAERLRDAVGLLQRPESLDLKPALRTRVLEACLERRPPSIPVPDWATAYDAETARLDALLQDFGDAEWQAPVRLRWYEEGGESDRRTTVAGVIAHLMTVDGLVAATLGLDDPLDGIAAPAGTPAARTEAYWRALHVPPSRGMRAQWRAQSHDLVRMVAFAGGGAGLMPVSYGDGCLMPLRDAMLDRAFECWLHAEDIAHAVDYPYELPSARHLNRMIDLAARLLPRALESRRGGPAARPGLHRHLVAAGGPGRSLRLEIEGSGGGEWLIPLDSPAEVGSAGHEVAHIALDGVEFCRLAAGHVSPQDAAAGQLGDRQAIRDVLFAAASLSRM